MKKKLTIKAELLPQKIEGKYFDMTIHGFWHNVKIEGMEDSWRIDDDVKPVKRILNLIDIEFFNKTLDDFYLDSSIEHLRVFDINGYFLKMQSSADKPLPHIVDYLDNGMHILYTSSKQRGFIAFEKSSIPIGRIGLMYQSDSSEKDQYLEIDVSDLEPLSTSIELKLKKFDKDHSLTEEF
tara:strand:+ start:143 stop:685 length:543 start_codon:yes stop_codon:yes gene_type:complete